MIDGEIILRFYHAGGDNSKVTGITQPVRHLDEIGPQDKLFIHLGRRFEEVIVHQLERSATALVVTRGVYGSGQFDSQGKEIPLWFDNWYGFPGVLGRTKFALVARDLDQGNVYKIQDGH